MATQELGCAEAESTKDEPLQKSGHNNPKEATQFVSDVTDLTNTFMQDIQGFDRYHAQDAYKMYIFNLKKRLVELDSTFFLNVNTETVLDTIPDKMCKLYVKRKPEGEQSIEKRVSAPVVPIGQNVITRLVQNAEPRPVGEDTKKIIMTIFSHLQDAHENIAQVAGTIMNLREVAHSDTFGFVLKLAVHPLIQLKIPTPHLCSPGDL